MSQDEMVSWRMFSWGHRVYTRARRLATATYRLMTKWRIVQLAVVGAMIALWLAVYTGPVASQLSQDQKYPRLPPPYAHGFDDPSEMFGMMKGQHVELPDGYHKRAYVYVGGHPVLTTFDTGSFRNAIRLEVLQELEAKQRAGRFGKRVISQRAPCNRMNVVGATTAMTASYDEVVEIEIGFRGSDGRSASAIITFVIMSELSSPMLLGCPTLDKLMFAMTGEAVELRAYDLEFPAVGPPTQCSAENVAILGELVTIQYIPRRCASCGSRPMPILRSSGRSEEQRICLHPFALPRVRRRL